jgi:flagellar assembly protein FliH
LQERQLATRSGNPGQIDVFQYPTGPESAEQSWQGWGAEEPAEPATEPAQKPASDQPFAALEAGLRSEFEQKLGEETRRSFEAGRERGRLEGQQAEREAQVGAQAATEERRIRQTTELIEKFSQERDRYLQGVEREVVELALAVAARILRREAQMDPLLLTGAVRVALGQLSGSTKVRLRVPAGELDLWTETIALLPNLAMKPAVVAGEGMRLGDCMIETEMGSVDLGIRAQLGEIERGFFDRAGGPRGEAAADGAAKPAAEARS